MFKTMNECMKWMDGWMEYWYGTSLFINIHVDIQMDKQRTDFVGPNMGVWADSI